MTVLRKVAVLTMAYANMAPRVDTHRTTQAAKKLLSSRVSNFMTVLRKVAVLRMA
jgi:hypothetical protein